MAELVSAAAPRQGAGAGFGVSPNRAVLGIPALETAMPVGIRATI